MPRADKATREKQRQAAQTQKARRIVSEAICGRMPELVQAQIDLALGVYFEDVGPDGVERRVYRAKPNAQTIEYLMNRELGRAVEMTDLTPEATERLVKVIVEEFESKPALRVAERRVG